MIRGKAVSFFCLLIATLLVVSMNVLPAFGVPGKGTSITVNNEVTGAATDSWSYTITELNPPKNSNPFYASFDLEAGGTYSFGGLRRGAYRVVETYESGYSTIVVTSNKYSGSEVVAGFEVVINLDPSEGKTVTFTNNINPAFAYAGLILSPPPDLDYSIPPLQPVPVQASFDVDVNDDGRWDLVLEKPIVVLVNMTGAEGVPFVSGDSIQVSVEFEAQVYSVTVDGGDLATSYIIAFYSATDPITPSSAGDKIITGIYQVNGGSPVSLTTTYVTVKDTVGLSLYYAPLSKSKSYGSPDFSAFDDMMQNSVDFIEATYPVGSVTAIGDSGQAIAGSKSGSGRDPYAGMLKDCQAVAQQAQILMSGSAIGVAVAPGDLNSGYFDYHGFPGAVGVSFGPAVKGVIALEGYYTVPAHEVAHTFGLYYGVPEEYYYSPTFTGSGVNVGTGDLRVGYSFMSVADYGTTGEALTWVNTDTTFEYLFRKTVVIPDDPEVLLVNGIIYEDGTVEFPLDWVHIQEGTPDTVTPGDYLLRYVEEDGNTILGEVSFDASFSMQPSYPDENGILIAGPSIEYDQAGFSFATPYPPEGTQYVQVIDSLTGNILATYDMDDVKSFSCYASLDGDEGSNGWFVGPVDVTISAIADPTALTPDYAVEEIHYILDEEPETIVAESSVAFTIPGEDDVHTLEYWAVDTDGNVGVHHTQTVGIDNTAPVVTINAPVDGTYYKTADVPDADFTVVELNSYDTPVEEGYSTVEGIHTYTVTVSDSAGNEGSDSVTYTVDNTAPDVTINAPVDGAVFSSGIFSVSGVAYDSASGVQKVEVKVDDGEYANADGTATWSFDVSGLGDGSHVIYARATDGAGNSDEKSISVTVREPYVFGGFTSPIPDSQYNKGRTLPVKFQLTDSQGNSITDAVATIYVAPVTDGEVGTWQLGLEKGGTTNVISYNSAGSMYQFNLDTSSLSPKGTWRIRVDLDDGNSYPIEIELK